MAFAELVVVAHLFAVVVFVEVCKGVCVVVVLLELRAPRFVVCVVVVALGEVIVGLMEFVFVRVAIEVVVGALVIVVIVVVVLGIAHWRKDLRGKADRSLATKTFCCVRHWLT